MALLSLFGVSADVVLDEFLIWGVAAVAGCIGAVGLVNLLDMLIEADAG